MILSLMTPLYIHIKNITPMDTTFRNTTQDSYILTIVIPTHILLMATQTTLTNNMNHSHQVSMCTILQTMKLYITTLPTITTTTTTGK